MSQLPGSNEAIQELRLSLGSQAARAERANRPTGLVVGAGVILLAALIALVVTFSTARAARADLARQRNQAQQTLEAAARFKALSDAATAQGGSMVQFTQVRSRIEQAGVDARLQKSVGVPKSRTDRPQGTGSTQTKLDYDVKDESLEALLKWMDLATASVPGLEVYSVSLKPEANVWNLRVTFSRWEKTEGS